MKTVGTILLVFSALNFIVAIAAAANSAGDAVGQKMSAAILLAVIGGLLYYFGKSREKKTTQAKAETERKRLEKEREAQKIREQQRQKQLEQQKEIKQRENSKKFKLLNFFLDCSHCAEQVAEFSKGSVTLPMETIDVESDETTVQKYRVNRLPKIILVDFNGKELHRWVGVTSVSEINEYLYKNGYISEQVLTESNKTNDSLFSEEESEDLPKPLKGGFTASDLARLQSEYMDQFIAIMADGGSKEQSMVKFELLLGKRKKTESMIAIENQIRSLYRKAYDMAMSDFEVPDSKDILATLAVTNQIMAVYKYFNDEDSEGHKTKEQITEIANQYGISVNLIESEEQNRALSKYRDGIDME